MEVYWLEQSAGDVPPGEDWLSPGEAARVRRFRFEQRREEWRLGRWTAKRAVAAFLCVPGGVVEIRAGPSGAPEAFVAGGRAAVCVSLSHRAGRAVCAVAHAPGALGCDLELLEARSGAFVADYFTAAEQALIARDRFRLAPLVWSAKESALKALGLGLTVDTLSVRVVDIDLGAACGWRSLRVRCPGVSFEGWWRQAGGYVRTVVALPPPKPPLFRAGTCPELALSR